MNIDEKIRHTQRIGNRINALAQAECAAVEAEGPPPAIAAQLDLLIDTLLSKP